MDKRTVWSWALFDFANSVFPAVMVATVFPIFYRDFVVGGQAGEGDWWWGRAVSLSALIVAFTSPLLGGIADRAGARKRFFMIYVGICLAGVVGMVTLDAGMALRGFLLFVVANVGFESALVFYNAYLPEIAPPEKRGWVSGLGFGVGYLGSALGLLIAVQLVQRELMWAVWLSVAAFFLLNSIPSFRYLPADRPGGVGVAKAAAWGVSNLASIVAEVWRLKDLRNFFFAYFFYIDGVNTIIAMAAIVAKGTFGFTTEETIILFLVLQFSALAGALAMAKPTDRAGPKAVLNAVLPLWIAAVTAAYFIEGQTAFYVLAVVAGLGLGSVQSASRAAMAALIPKGREGEMFGFYALCGKSSSVIGPFLFGLAVLLAEGNQRPGFLVVAGLLLAGFLLLQRVKGALQPS